MTSSNRWTGRCWTGRPAALLLACAALAACAPAAEPEGEGVAPASAAVPAGDGAAPASEDAATASEEAATAGEDAATASVDVATSLDFLRQREVFLPQFAAAPGGALYIVWREPAAERGGNLFIARRSDSGVFTPPVRINHIDGTVVGGSLDEGRPAVAVGADGVLAVAWTAPGSDILAAISRDGGESFDATVTLNSDEGARAYRGFVDIDVDRAGVAHAAWIDGRFAPRGAEEPAELFYARIDGSAVTETNLTEDQADSICGCCRIDVDVRTDDRLVIAFRNTGDGYRDVFRIEAGADRVFGTPARLGPPMWELNGCPVIGPLNVGEATLWSEASTGKRRILAAVGTDGGYELVAEDSEEWSIERPPRLIAGADPAVTLLLVPGRPVGKIFRGSGTQWTVSANDVPRWAMSAAWVGDRLVVIGDLNGEVQVEALPVVF